MNDENYKKPARKRGAKATRSNDDSVGRKATKPFAAKGAHGKPRPGETRGASRGKSFGKRRNGDDGKPPRDAEDRPYGKRGAERESRPHNDRKEGEDARSSPSGTTGRRFPHRSGDVEGARDHKRFAGGGRSAPGKRGDDRFQDKSKGGGRKERSRPDDDASEAGERIAKRLARAGIASRRDAERLIADGRIKVNGTVLTTPAFNVTPTDVIHLDGTEIPPVERTRLFLFHKPAGLVTTTRDPEGRRTVFDILPAELPRVLTVGRLDINTEGLLLLTNDGGLARVLELPATGWLRRYRARVHGKVDEKALADLANGIAVDGVFYGAIEASLERIQGTNAWLTIGLREGKNREVRNVLGALDLEVTRLIRVSYGPFQLGELPEGHVLEIKGRTLREQLGERLIEESGANFEADILKPFSNRPVSRQEDKSSKPHAKFRRDGDRRPIGEGGLIKARKRREDSRDEALGKLSTRPQTDSAGRKGGFSDKRGGRPAREAVKVDPPSQRRSNVWMAPGAKPKGDAKAETSGRPDRGAKRSGKGRSAGPRKKH